MRVGIWFGVALVGFAGCRNSCQQICTRMADYAEECEFPVSDAEVDACMERQSTGLEKEDAQACRDFGDPAILRAQWSCDDLSQYWTASGA